MTSHGDFIWHELMTSDLKGAAAFYGHVVGWGAEDARTPGITYMLFTMNGVPSTGFMELPDRVREAGGRPGWTGHVAVNDVDATAAAARAAGGSVHHVPTDIPGVGRFAVLSDPQGAMFAIFKGAGAPPPAPPPGTPGRTGWNELHTTDPEAAFAFYSGLFGWTKGTPIDMGPMGTYQLFGNGGADFGGIMPKQPVIPASFWQYYFNVPDIKIAAAKVAEAGGEVLNGPMEVPGGLWVLNGIDPQGAVFAVVAPS